MYWVLRYDVARTEVKRSAVLMERLLWSTIGSPTHKVGGEWLLCERSILWRSKVQIWGKMLLFGKNQPVSVSPVSLGSAKLRNRWVGTQWCGPLVAGGTEPLAFVPKRLRGDPYWNRTWSMSSATSSQGPRGENMNYFLRVIPTNWDSIRHIFWHSVWHSIWHSQWYVFGSIGTHQSQPTGGGRRRSCTFAKL